MITARLAMAATVRRLAMGSAHRRATGSGHPVAIIARPAAATVLRPLAAIVHRQAAAIAHPAVAAGPRAVAVTTAHHKADSTVAIVHHARKANRPVSKPSKNAAIYAAFFI